MLKTVTLQVAGVRPPGAAALDLADVAGARRCILGNRPGSVGHRRRTLLIQEAGGRIGTLDGAEYRQEGTSSPALPR